MLPEPSWSWEPLPARLFRSSTREHSCRGMQQRVTEILSRWAGKKLFRFAYLKFRCGARVCTARGLNGLLNLWLKVSLTKQLGNRIKVPVVSAKRSREKVLHGRDIFVFTERPYKNGKYTAYNCRWRPERFVKLFARLFVSDLTLRKQILRVPRKLCTSRR